MEATVESLTNLGVGVCRVKLPEGVEVDGDVDSNGDGEGKKKDWVVFVPSVIPGGEQTKKCEAFYSCSHPHTSSLLLPSQNSFNSAYTETSPRTVPPISSQSSPPPLTVSPLNAP